MKLWLTFNQRFRLGLDRFVGLIKIKSLGKRLRDMKRRIDETFETISLRIAEIERPGITVADWQNRIDTRRD